jgi:hypothetical protein
MKTATGRRSAKIFTQWGLLAVTGLLAGCLLLVPSQPTELKLHNSCPFPLLVVVIYDSSVQKNVKMDAGDTQSLQATHDDHAESLTVERNGEVLYTYSLSPQHEILTYLLTPTGVTIKGQ